MVEKSSTTLPVLAPVSLRDPWPVDHEPRTEGERRLWYSFEKLRRDRTVRLSASKVATAIGMSRTVISMENCSFQVLRRHIV